MIDQNREKIAREAFAKSPEKFSSESKSSVLLQKIALGMTPYEAHLAGGAFAYQVTLDPKRWDKGAAPLRIIEAQLVAPDDSEITLVFRNDTQFSGEGIVPFRVKIDAGRVVSIGKA